jgi:hypothetical protein
MSEVVQFRQRSGSDEVIQKLIKLGYLRQSQRFDDHATGRALAKLQNDLCRDQMISSGDPTKSA